jgi:hypothetical protein
MPVLVRTKYIIDDIRFFIRPGVGGRNRKKMVIIVSCLRYDRITAPAAVLTRRQQLRCAAVEFKFSNSTSLLRNVSAQQKYTAGALFRSRLYLLAEVVQQYNNIAALYHCQQVINNNGERGFFHFWSRLLWDLNTYFAHKQAHLILNYLL